MFPVFPVADMTLTGIGAPFTFATAVGVIVAGIAGLILTIVLDN